MVSERFTPRAKIFWNNIPPDIQDRLLNNVYCTRCRSMTTIANYNGRIEQGDLILEGFCLRCGSPVSRLIEGELYDQVRLSD